MFPEQDQTDAPGSLPSSGQFQTPSPVAMRHHLAELERNQGELKERLRRQEQSTRNAIGAGVLSVVLAVTAITLSLYWRATNLHSNTPLAAQSHRVRPPAVLVTME